MKRTRTRISALGLSALIAVQIFAPLPAAAQTSGLTYEQVQRKYRSMSSVHIKKCDKDGDGIYSRVEYNCVQSIYRVMYLSR